MKAFQFSTVEKGLHLEDVPEPKAGPGEVVITVHAAGLCHSDGHTLKGEGGQWMGENPTTLGHEAAGMVVELGPDVTGFKIGDRVGVSVDPDAGPDWRSHVIGVGRDGAFAKKLVAPAYTLVHIPEGVSFAEAAVASDSISTAYHAIAAEGNVQAGTTVAVVGLGGLGLNGVRVASIRRATVLGVDIDDKKFEEAKAFGADECYRSLNDIPDSITIDVIVDYAGAGVTTQAAMLKVKPHGTIVLVGLGVSGFHLSSHTFVLRALTLRASRGSTTAEYREVLDLIAAGKIKPKLEEIPFLGIPEGIQRLERLEVVGRLWANPQLS